MNYQENTPYPTPQVERPNLEYAKLLMSDYAGIISEDTAIHLYLYQHLVLENEDQDIANILEKIAEVEMHHLELLGKTITLLGIKPIYGTYENNKIEYWTSKFVNYNTNLKDILQINIYSETQAIKKYQEDLKIIQDIYIQNLLKRIIADEKIHLHIFNQLYFNQKQKER